METLYSGRNHQVTKPNLGGRKHGSKPSGLKIGGLSLDIDQINQEYDQKEGINNKK